MSIPEIRPGDGSVPGFAVRTSAGTAAVGSFAAVLANEMPSLSASEPGDVDWMAYRRAVFTLDETENRKRLKALRKRDPALAARLERILRQPAWDQPALLAEAAASHSRRAAETQPDRPGEVAFHAHRALMARSLSLSSIFDRPDLVRWA